MKTVTISVASMDNVMRRASAAFKGKAQGSHITFASAELLWTALTTKRWEVLKALSGAGAVSLREAARRVGRDVKAVHGDVHALLDAGILRKTPDGKIEFPFDAVHVDFVLKAA